MNTDEVGAAKRGGGGGGGGTDPRKNPVLYMRGGSSVTHENSQFLFPGCISIQFVR